MSMRWVIILERKSLNRLPVDINKAKLAKIAASASRNKSLGFDAKAEKKFPEPVRVYDEESKQEMFHYRTRLLVKKAVVRSPETVEVKFKHVLNVVTQCANSHNWTVTESGPYVRGSEEPQKVATPSPSRPTFALPALNDAVLSTYFGGIYERNDQILELYDALRTHVETGGTLANHVILYGQPGACKTVLAERFQVWLDNEGSTQPYPWVKFVDGTTVTKAGVENWFRSLIESEDAPVMLVLDEIEKQEKTWLLGLLSIMGSGVLTKLNAYTGNIRHRFAPFIVGICNDERALKEFKNESLWSRFTHELHCPRPTRELSLHILRDLGSQIPGYNPDWAMKALEFGWDDLGQRDIRKIKGHLDGRDRLLTGEWQRAKKRQLEIEAREKAAIAREREAAMDRVSPRTESSVLPTSTDRISREYSFGTTLLTTNDNK